MFRFASTATAISACFLLVLATACQTPSSTEQKLPAPVAQQVETPVFSLQSDWRLTSLGGQKVSAGADGAAYLRFAEDNRVTGYGSCNRIIGTYLREGQQTTFSKMAATRRLCLASMEIEDSFFKALEATRNWDITENGTVLRFYDADKHLLLEMEAVKRNDN